MYETYMIFFKILEALFSSYEHFSNFLMFTIIVVLLKLHFKSCVLIHSRSCATASKVISCTSFTILCYAFVRDFNNMQ